MSAEPSHPDRLLASIKGLGLELDVQNLKLQLDLHQHAISAIVQALMHDDATAIAQIRRILTAMDTFQIVVDQLDAATNPPQETP